MTADPLIGTEIDERYRIRRVIGAGGQGVVYLADTLEAPKREVVLKVLNATGAHQEEAVARFDREADQLRSVSHDNIVKMLGYGHVHGRPYIVMEYVRGQSLQNFLSKRGPLSVREFVPIAAQVLKAVGHVHSRGIMVRDIKPANIMLCRHRGRENYVKLLDFGLAKLVGDQEGITSNHIVGTVGFLSPEQIRSEPFDLRVDVFALGVLFYFCLTKQLPYHGETTEATLFATVNDSPQPLSEVVETSTELTPELEDLIMRCIAQDPEDRPSHADEVVEGLIDAVPVTMFRLPKAAGPPTSTLTTGSLRLDEHRDRPAPPRPANERHTEALGETVGMDAAVAAAEVVEAESMPVRSRSGAVYGIAAAAALVAGAVAWFVAGSDAPEPPAPVPVATASTPSVEASPAPQALATLEIAVEPTAEILIDGTPYGTNPGALSLPPGTVEIRAQADGHQTWSKSIALEAGKTTSLQVALTATAAAEPPNADDEPEVVIVDDTPAKPASARSKRKRSKAAPSEAPPEPTAAPTPTKPTIAPGTMPRRKGSSNGSRKLDNDVWGD